MKRHESREAAFLLTFETIINGQSPDETLEIAAECEELDGGLFEIDHRAKQVFVGVYENQSALDAEIQKHLNGWTIPRISKVALAALRVALYEIDYCDDVDTRVAISEAVKLTEAYALKEDVRFVNGVLSSVAKERNA